eukprot:COSAG05_NODE_1137_length_5751_cov_9.852619_4_plen_961_part_00
MNSCRPAPTKKQKNQQQRAADDGSDSDEADAGGAPAEHAGNAGVIGATGRRRKAPESFSEYQAKERETAGTRRRRNNHGGGAHGGSSNAAKLKAEQSRWKAEREVREHTRRLLLRELWKKTAQPAEGAGLVGWMVEVTGASASATKKEDRDEIATGRVVLYTPPDEYIVEWAIDGSTSVFGFSDLFSPGGELPILLPFAPETLQDWGRVNLAGQVGTKRKRLPKIPSAARAAGLRAKQLVSTAAAADGGGDAATHSSPADASSAEATGTTESSGAATGAAAAAAGDGGGGRGVDCPYEEGDRVAVLFDMIDASDRRKKQWFDGTIVFHDVLHEDTASHAADYTVLFDDGDELVITGDVWRFNGDVWRTQKKIKKTGPTTATTTAATQSKPNPEQNAGLSTGEAGRGVKSGGEQPGTTQAQRRRDSSDGSGGEGRRNWSAAEYARLTEMMEPGHAAMDWAGKAAVLNAEFGSKRSASSVGMGWARYQKKLEKKRAMAGDGSSGGGGGGGGGATGASADSSAAPPSVSGASSEGDSSASAVSADDSSSGGGGGSSGGPGRAHSVSHGRGSGRRAVSIRQVGTTEWVHYATGQEAANAIGVHPTGVSQCCRGKQASTRNYECRFYKDTLLEDDSGGAAAAAAAAVAGPLDADPADVSRLSPSGSAVGAAKKKRTAAGTEQQQKTIARVLDKRWVLPALAAEPDTAAAEAPAAAAVTTSTAPLPGSTAEYKVQYEAAAADEPLPQQEGKEAAVWVGIDAIADAPTALPLLIEYERRTADAGLSQGQEILAVRCLRFGSAGTCHRSPEPEWPNAPISPSLFSPAACACSLFSVMPQCDVAPESRSRGRSVRSHAAVLTARSLAAPPPEFEYIVSNELVGAAASWAPNPSYVLTEPTEPGPLSLSIAEQVQNLQHSLDRRGRAYNEMGRLRFARDIVYETPVAVFTPTAGAYGRLLPRHRVGGCLD